MYGRIVKHDALIVVRSAFGNVSRPRQGKAHEEMPDNKREGCPLLLRERQDLRCKAAYRIAIECVIARYPEASQNRRQWRCSFTELFGLFDQCTRFFDGGSCLWRSKAFQHPEGVN